MMKGLAYKGVGPNVFQTWIFATILAAFVGILIAPPQHRKAARYIFIAMPVALSAVLILDNFVEHTVNVANEFEEIAGSVMGGLIVWRINRGQWRP